MRLLSLLLLPLYLLFAHENSLLFDQENPALFEHVNVITGHLSLFLEDEILKAPLPLPIQRTYSSSGALERHPRNVDLFFRDMQSGWWIQGGWTLFPHMNLIVNDDQRDENITVSLPDPSGNSLTYFYSYKESKHILILKPKSSEAQNSGRLSFRNNAQNNTLRLDLKKGEATLFLPTGGTRFYRGRVLHPMPAHFFTHFFYRLEEEILPNGHRICFTYDLQKKHKQTHRYLNKIELKNPAATKVYASINFEGTETSPLHLKLKTSDGKELTYSTTLFEERQYLHEVKGSSRPDEKIDLVPGRKGIGARLQAFCLGNLPQFVVSYYLPLSQKKEREWASSPEKKDFHIDKVEKIEAPVGAQEELVTLAHFAYFPGRTDVKDANNLLTRYHYKNNKILLIESFDDKGLLFSSQKFYWEGSFLKTKALLNGVGDLVFAKQFFYEEGDVVKEVLYGDLTQKDACYMWLDDAGEIHGGERYTKHYKYAKDSHLLIEETEDEGPSYEYVYKPRTDLLEAKFTKDKAGKILKRELFFYDGDNLLVKEAIDDASVRDPHAYTGACQRLEKWYSLSEKGVPEKISERAIDLKTGKSHLIQEAHLKYKNGDVVEEAIYDREGNYSHSIYTNYNNLGKVSRKVSPCGDSTYLYNNLGLLVESKEAGESRKTLCYNTLGQKISCVEEESGKVFTWSYDVKGRLLTESDGRGNTTSHTYDAFGNRIKTTLPCTRDETGALFTQALFFKHDLMGNLIESHSLEGKSSQIEYTLLRKPSQIIEADGAKTTHLYSPSGMLIQTTYPDLSRLEYTYDLFQRKTSEKLYSSNGDLLSEEAWAYNTFHLISHTDARGLQTLFFYDEAGRKIRQQQEDRFVVYSYDLLGRLEKVDNGHFSHWEKHNFAGQIIEQWDEDLEGNLENQMSFFYDKEGRKEKAIRLTSQGKAVDLFTYTQGILSSHTDPLGGITLYLYNPLFKNELNQNVLQKKVIDPLGNACIETHDVAGRPLCIEKKDPQGQLVFCEEFFYDRSGNLAKRRSPVLWEGKVVREQVVSWRHDSRGRIIEENQGGLRFTLFSYDDKGRLKTKTLPSGTTLFYAYDALDRQTELKSSDNSVHLIWEYEKGSEPTTLSDLKNGYTLRRGYNLFGELIEESSSLGTPLKWEYDTLGREKKFTLPDGSCVAYLYEGMHLKRVERKDALENSLYEHTYLHFDPTGHVAQEETIFQLGVVETTHDLMERPLFQTSPWQTHSLTYGPSGLIQERENTLLGPKEYDHDALNQLSKEGELTYAFDSLGNSLDHEVDSLGQLLSTAEAHFIYDKNGNLQEKTTQEGTTSYTYDALARLKNITYPDGKKVTYTYDPLSRLRSKHIEGKEGAQFYLYDQDYEVGSLSEKGRVLDFKTLGCGVKGDIGAAIALEIEGQVYLPLHDFSGNIVALVGHDGAILEKYPFSSFGKEEEAANFLSPWRFASKRAEEGLIYFGLRFYDPDVGRWITPDPSGFTDSANLYVYVLNSPLKRLDLFGLYAEDASGFPKIEIYVPRAQIVSMRPVGGILCQGKINDVHVNFYVFHTQWHKLQFTPAEEGSHHINLLDHLHELVPTEGGNVGFISFGNGINTSLSEFSQAAAHIGNTAAGPLTIGLYNRTEGILKDLNRVAKERSGDETPTICKTRQFLSFMADKLEKINPNALWLSLHHSENGLVIRRAIEGASSEEKIKLKKVLHILAIGPADCVPMGYGASVVNLYSEKDYVTGFGKFGYAKGYMDHPDYDVRILKCQTPCSQRNFFFADHGFLMPTYRGAIQIHFDYFHQQFGMYGRDSHAKNR